MDDAILDLIARGGGTLTLGGVALFVLYMAVKRLLWNDGHERDLYERLKADADECRERENKCRAECRKQEQEAVLWRSRALELGWKDEPEGG